MRLISNCQGRWLILDGLVIAFRRFVANLTRLPVRCEECRNGRMSRNVEPINDGTAKKVAGIAWALCECCVVICR